MAVDGADALRVFDEGCERGTNFDVVFLDIMMPVMDGWECCVQLRQKNFTGPIVAISANTMCEDAQKMADAGFDLFLPKPVGKSQIAAALDSVLRK
eukprot:TRINITY_DN34768_c0_g1_i2.p1 TRINITY_DN34768_c0_g1~~TRINITY_DN34768_c0_g1_i2.p1  ORF type:complete len:109 (-),score=10.72 TRINITY_DN34768_c0_g1_i2:67-354(-)